MRPNPLKPRHFSETHILIGFWGKPLVVDVV